MSKPLQEQVLALEKHCDWAVVSYVSGSQSPPSSALTCGPPTYQFTFHTLPVYLYLSIVGPSTNPCQLPILLLVCLPVSLSVCLPAFLSVCLYLAFRGKRQKRTCWDCFP